jgi:hypothetical protein
MSRDLKLNILVDDHGAVQKLEDVATAEDHVTASATKASAALDQSTASVRATSVSVGEADRYLSDMHANLSRMPSTLSLARGGLNDLAAGVGLTVAELGLMGVAGAVVATAIGAWKVGTWIGNVTGLTRAVTEDTAALMGWGNVAEQEAGAKADVLARASAFAGREITNLTEAMDFNRIAAEENALRLQAVAHGAELAEAAHKALRDELIAADERFHKWTDDLDREAAASAQRDREELARFTEKIHAIEHGGDHAFATLHQWYGEMHRDQQHMNDLIDASAQKLIHAQQQAQQFLFDALNAAKAIDAELGLAGPIGHGPTTPNDGSPLNPSPIVVHPIGPLAPPPGVVSLGGQNSNTTLRSFDAGGPTGSGGLSLLHPGEFVVPRGGALVKGGGGTVVNVNIDARGANFEDDRALARLADKIAQQVGVRAWQLGAL